MRNLGGTARRQPTFRKSRTSSSPRPAAVASALAVVALLAVVSAVVLSAHGQAARSSAPTSSARTAPASARVVAEAAPARTKRSGKRTSTSSTTAARKHASAAATVAKGAGSRTHTAAAKPTAQTRAGTAASKGARAVAAVSKPKTLPEQMRSVLGGSTQMIVITGARIGSRSGTMRIFNKNAGRWVQVFSAPANFGANGLVDGAKRRQGNLQTPTGTWHMDSFLFGQHGSAPSGTKMRYRAITSRSWWSCQPDSTYNTWVESGSHVSGEHLAGATVQYEYAFNTGYNSLPNQRVMGRGTAIFIHCFEPAGNSLGKYTHGCIALSRASMRRVFTVLDPARHPSCAIGTLATGTSTSIWSY